MRHSTRIKSRHACVAFAIVAACSGDRPPTDGFRLDTLASGQIVATNAFDPARPPSVRLEEVLRFGTADGVGASTFGKVLDVSIGPDSLLYVLDGMSADIRVIDLQGRYVRSIAGAGDGPGELRAPYAIDFGPEGNLWVSDERQRRYTVFDLAGAVVRTLDRPMRWPVTTGELLVSEEYVEEFGWWGSGPGGNIRLAMNGGRLVVHDTIPIPPFDLPLFSRPDGRGIGLPVPFAPRQAAAIGASGSLWIGHGSQYRLAQISGTGDTVRIVELEAPAAPLSPAEEAAAQDTVRLAREQGLDVDPALIRSSHPFFTSFVVADDGHLWVRRPVAVAAQSPAMMAAVYDVFTPAGRYLGSVPAPVAEWPAPQVARGFLVGVIRDDLDIDFVAVYRVYVDAG